MSYRARFAKFVAVLALAVAAVAVPAGLSHTDAPAGPAPTTVVADGTNDLGWQ